jgi:hypothetical protein
MSGSVKLIDRLTGSILFECPIEEIESAYTKAEEYEEMGLDIELKAPSMPETLIRSLGATEDSVELLNKGIEEEIASHIEEEVGCAVCLPEDNSKVH